MISRRSLFSFVAAAAAVPVSAVLCSRTPEQAFAAINSNTGVMWLRLRSGCVPSDEWKENLQKLIAES